MKPSEFNRLCDQMDTQYAAGQIDDMLSTVRQLAMRRLRGDEDGAQDVIVKVMEGLGSYRPEAPFRNWVNTIITHTCADAGRHEAKDNVLNFRDDPARQHAAAVDDDWEIDDYEFPDLSRIPDPLIRRVVERMEAGGYTLAEIAKSFDMTPSALYSRVSRYRKASKLAIVKNNAA